MERSPVDSTELRLLAAAAAGDRQARNDLFIRFRDDAYRVAYRITGREEDALDVVQDAFIKAFDGLSRFQGDAGFRTWILRIVSNRALDVLRSRKVRLAVSLDGDDAHRPDPPDREPGPAESGRLEGQELAIRLQAAVSSLPADQRTVFSMYAAGEMTYAEIAEAVGIPIGTVMSRLYHARRKLRELLPDLAEQFAASGPQESET